ncbi:MAG: PEGA domain-containing protein [Deltaproteobacteria bacterium]|nr:PEGA domain-containing protein [Deltaproteobacteria bacterium]
MLRLTRHQPFRRGVPPAGRMGALAAFAAAGLFGAPAPAQPPEGGTSEASGSAGDGTPGQSATAEISDEDREAARQAYRRGKRLLDRNRFEEALEEFGQSYALYPHWATSNSMGVCHDHLGRPNDALRLYEQALREGGDEIPERQREELEQRVAALRIQLGIREVTTGTIRVATSPGGALVQLDGADAGVSPIDLEVQPGSHRIDVTLDGYAPNGMDITVAVGQTALAQLALVAAVVAPTSGRLVCASDPDGARVVVDGAELGRTPLTLPEIAAGEHLVRVELDEERVTEETINVPADGTARVTVSFGGRVHQGWFWGVASAAVALGAGAAGTGVYGKSLYDEFHDSSTSRARQEEIQPLGQDMMLTTDILASAAGACAAVAVLLAIWTDWGGEGRVDVGYEGPAAPQVEPVLPAPGEDTLPDFPEEATEVSSR